MLLNVYCIIFVSHALSLNSVCVLSIQILAVYGKAHWLLLYFSKTTVLR